MTHQIFISFSSQNGPIANELCDRLERRGVRCWISSRNIEPGKDYAAQIVEAISGSRMLLLVFTKESNSSPHVLREVERAVSRGLAIVPLRFDDVPLSPSMEYHISSVQWLPAAGKSMEEIAGRVAAVLAGEEPPQRGVRPPTPLPAKAAGESPFAAMPAPSAPPAAFPAPPGRAARPTSRPVWGIILALLSIGVFAVVSLMFCGGLLTYQGTISSAHEATARTQIGMLQSAVRSYEIDTGQPPSSSQGLSVLETRPADGSPWNGPYLDKAVPKDPWGRDYFYESTGSGFRIWSAGPDGQTGTSDDIEGQT